MRQFSKMIAFVLSILLAFGLAGCDSDKGSTSPAVIWGSEGIYKIEDFGNSRVYEYGKPVTFKVWIGYVEQNEENLIETAYLVITWGVRDDSEAIHSAVIEIDNFTNEKYQVSKKWYNRSDFSYSQYIEVTLDIPEESLREFGNIDFILCGSYVTLEDGNFSYGGGISNEDHELYYWKTDEGLKIKNLK